VNGPAVTRALRAPRPQRGRPFARTWWAQAWLRALEETALDSRPLREGRAAARRGAVGTVGVGAGRITALVRGTDGESHRADVLVRPLDDAGWDRFLDVVSREAGHLAALLDGELPRTLVQDALHADADLVPGVGDLEAECGCGEWDHCAHTAALCCVTAALLDQDPLLLLLLRGRAPEAVLAEAGRRATASAETAEATDASAARPGAGAEATDSVPAAEVYAAPPVPLPPPPPGVPEPGRPPALTGATAPAPVPDVGALEALAAGTAACAARLLARALAPDHAATPVPPRQDVRQDAVRLAAAAPEHQRAALARGSGRTEPEMAAAVRAWRHGGTEAVRALEERWEPGEAELAHAAALLAAARDEEGRPVLRRAGNRWTVAGSPVQLRWARDGRWWAFRREAGGWCPAGGPGDDPAAVLAALPED
jgi:uncharacterized Zn finger protein